ncbi:acetyl-CoA carboxylase family protein [Ottowia oryzae]|uniref:Carbamoyl-phosphate synthase large subunit n=1 Tax=Ottowia oryzae TaxID=2109914 RepID=A0A2S0MBC3_9BURK|nr:carboxyl transferase domain-containing protein [Ottowia oryzae]AVO33120.1 carbamoyl-phosphate synthase large subunit [Ottowia oryzae]
MSSTAFHKVLIANRGEVAVRLIHALRDAGIASLAVYAQDDAEALHVQLADEAVPLAASGPAAYLDAAAVIAIARAHGADAVHPGWGFLSEQADFARACAAAGLVFIGPEPEQLALFGDKARARALAAAEAVPCMPGIDHAVTLEEAAAFFAAQAADGAAMIIKAVGGGGGRGMRVVERAEDVAASWARCRSEAKAAFGVEGVYVERFMPRARHIEVQVIGDGAQVVALGERECTLQRRFQKLVEIAPSPTLSPALREQIASAALRMARAVGYRSLGTFEFLVDENSAALPSVFIEANARLQVEHTITEAVTGLDLVQLQLGVAQGRTLADLGLAPGVPVPVRGHAIQWRINAETLTADGQARPASGSLQRFDLPSGPGVRVDTHGRAGLAPSPHYDTLLAKLIVHHPSSDFAAALRRSRGALAEFGIGGIATNLPLLRALADRPETASQAVDNRFVERELPTLLQAAEALAARSSEAAAPAPIGAALAQEADPTDGSTLVRAPMAAKLVQWEVAVGDVVPAGATLGVLEAMKMEHVLHAPIAARVVALPAQPGEFLVEGQALVRLATVDAQGVATAVAEEVDLDQPRPDLQRVIDRHAFTLDANRPAAMARRHAQGGRSARENIADLCELHATESEAATAGATPARAGNFIEYGALAIAAQRTRRTLEDLVANTPADGMVTGIGSVNEALFGPERSRCAIMAYDYTVLAGTQGWRNHHKKDRLLALAHQLRIPLVLFAEGGGGRPGDVDMPILAGLNNHTFSQFAALSGKVPVVGVVHGRCFAGNAALLGCCDAIIATRVSNIGMGGPAMIEGGGLGSFAPEQIGPADVQSASGVIDVLVQDEAEAVATARQYLGYFQGSVADWQCADQRRLRHAIPENRLRVYDVRAVARGLFDTGSWLELRAGFGAGMVTGLARVEGRPVAVLANNPHHLGGAIDPDAADKAARFMQLANAHGLPIVALVDTPGFMVGPEIETKAQVRHTSRMFMIASHLRVPYFSVVLRKGYGLGAQAMTAGGFDAPVFNIAWPTGEFGAMGLEGAVRLGFRKELEAVPEGAERDALFQQLVARQYANGEAMSMAQTLEIDAVIDPADTRAWLARGLASATAAVGAAQPFVDAW